MAQVSVTCPGSGGLWEILLEVSQPLLWDEAVVTMGLH